MLKVGDKVKFLNDVGGGVITSFVSKKVVNVENEDGFEIPVLLTELVKVVDFSAPPTYSGDSRQGIAEPKAEQKSSKRVIAPTVIKGNDDPKFYFAFHPKDQTNPLNSEIEMHLINDSNFILLYHFSTFDGSEYKTVDFGELEPNTKTYLDGIAQSDLSDLPKFWFRIIPILKNSKDLYDPITKEISVQPMKFYKDKSFEKNEFFKGNAMIFSLITSELSESIERITDKDFKKVVNAKDKDHRPKEEAPKKKRSKDIVEIDLHIDELIDSTTGLSNKEILEIQMDRFESEIQLAIKNGNKRIVFIHGVGNGVLKNEVNRELKRKYKKYDHQDASFKEYGFGATMVILKR